MDESTNAPADGHPSSAGFAITQNDISRDPTLPKEVKSVYTALAGYADKGRVAWPGQDRLAWETSMSLRAVGKAIRAGADCGLWTVIHTQTSNRYQLHDHADDPKRYVPGRGPRTLPQIPVGTTCRLDKHVVPIGSARGADEQDQRAVPEIPTQQTSSNAAAADSPPSEARSRTISRPPNFTPIRIDLADDFWKLSDNYAIQRMIRSSIGALRAAGFELAPDARERLTRSLKETLGKVSREETVKRLTHTLELTVQRDEAWAYLADPIATEAS